MIYIILTDYNILFEQIKTLKILIYWEFLIYWD